MSQETIDKIREVLRDEHEGAKRLVAAVIVSAILLTTALAMLAIFFVFQSFGAWTRGGQVAALLYAIWPTIWIIRLCRGVFASDKEAS